jgi:hypothetical protein
MPNGEVIQDLQLSKETIAIPPSNVTDHNGIVVLTRTNLDGASKAAQLKFANAIQNYAERMAIESINQEISQRAPGADSAEITESAVIRAKDALDKRVASQLQKKPSRLEPWTLAGASIFTGAAGIMGTYLHSLPQVFAFSVLIVLAIACILHQSTRRKGQ